MKWVVLLVGVGVFALAGGFGAARLASSHELVTARAGDARVDLPRPRPAPAADEAPIRRSRPKLVEPEAGTPAGGAAEDEEDSEDQRSSGNDDPPPSDAEIRAALVQFERYRRTVRVRDFTNDLLTPETLGSITGWRTSVASVYYDFGGPLACGGRLGREQLGVAHKTAPCGTMVTFRYGNRGIRVPVIDRGPYIEGREWDLTGATAVALNFPGLGEIDWKIG